MKIKFLFLLLVLILISCKENKITFIQMCDTQLGFGGYEEDKIRFVKAVEKINLLNPDFVLVCGDLVDRANEKSFEDFLEIKEKFKVPCFLAPGNHDVGNNPNSKSLEFYRKKIGADYFVQEFENYALVVANSQLWKVEVEEESQKHNDWFLETIKNLNSKNKNIFVGMHFPFFVENVKEEENYYNFPIGKRLEILEFLSENEIKAVFSGHAHKTIFNNYKNIKLASTETTSRNFDKRPFGFRLWTFDTKNDSLSNKFYGLEETK